jgi:hypothetical protein
MLLFFMIPTFNIIFILLKYLEYKESFLTVQRISAKCLYPLSKKRSFVLPVPGIKKHQRTTEISPLERQGGDDREGLRG